MSLIDKTVKDAYAGSLVITPQIVRSLKKFVSNSQHRHSQGEIQNVLDVVTGKDFHLSPEFNADSLKWVDDLLFRKNGDWRDTPEARKFGRRERIGIANVTHFTFAGMHRTIVEYGRRNYPEFERSEDVHPLYRAHSPFGYVEFIYRPWQTHYLDKTKVGFLLTGAGPDLEK